jgi:hypothetical protein
MNRSRTFSWQDPMIGAKAAPTMTEPELKVNFLKPLKVIQVKSFVRAKRFT